MSLKRGLGPMQIQLISLGGIIGSGYFMGVGSTIAENGTASILAYILGGVIVWLVAIAMGELSVGMPRAGSFISQSRELLGKHWAAGVGWSYWFNWCAYIPSEMVAGGMILHRFFPHISVISWASLFGIIITGVNLMNVKYFGRIESTLALLKITAMTTFTGVAACILFGLKTGTPVPPTAQILAEPFPGGNFAFLATMVLVLVNFQGTELIALSAAETADPEKSIPKASRNVALRSIALYVLPLTLLILIFPWKEAGVERSVFSEALFRYNFKGLAQLFDLMIVTAALSCANSGLYGAARSLYGLGVEKMAPQFVTRLNHADVPAAATLMTIAGCWAFLPLYTFFEGSHFYTWLLSVSGFTGSICWISISLCQIRFRQKLAKKASSLPYKMPGFPILSWVSVGLQTGCILLIVFHPTLRSALVLGVPSFLIPVFVSWVTSKN
ncbi:MAG: amino acid permease [Bdellovibrionota bacterium]